MPSGEPLRPDDPARIGPYTLLGRLGAGGQGVVYAGAAPSGARVAVKLLRAGFDDRDARARFLRELDTAKRVSQFCTAAVLDADAVGDRPYIVSELVDGPPLQEVVRERGPLAGGALERLAVGTATALVAIHRAGVVHRDLKPHNVLLGPDGPRVIDFGIARALDGATLTAGGIVGTPAYMAPEQFSGERAGPASDVFAWAGTMVFASCGRPPFGNDSLAAVSGRILHAEPDLGGLAGPLRDLVARCLGKDPAHRPTASQVLETLLGRRALPPAPETPTVVPGQDATAASARRAPVRRTRLLLLGVVGVFLAAALATGPALHSAFSSDPPAAPSPSASGRPAPAGFAPGFAGTWTGRVRQSDGKVLTVILKLPAGSARGTVRYPGQRCSGTETLLGQTGEVLTLREQITGGAARCVAAGTVTLARRPGGLTFNYTAASKGRTWAVVGSLARTP
ncbi:serine/threonine-protein kinase [Actinomadura parmotrematis]|uniref:Serine/threonine protein kinase n=1 Tax=Actinomadura parmotrematis TaxID=2864039 RepID=A0ABS7FVX7_9ACTN|nr:serine/threonine-protein kinase [Actinomadura parmotrematis]MBW8483732.1 serine/threonine protein kinase [Actinomadura parmotrematis]